MGIRHCLKCGAFCEVRLGNNMLGEEVEIINCRKCGSLSVCRDGVHWNIVVESSINGLKR